MKDILASELDVLFCGINPGLSSAAVGLPFATRGSRWWPALHRSGFTPRVLAPAEADRLLTWGLGLTTMVRRPTTKAAELTQAELRTGATELTERVHTWRPRWLAVLGVTAHYPPRRLAEEFARLRRAAGLPDRSLAGPQQNPV